MKFSLETNVKCQEDSPFAPQIMTDYFPLLSLNQTEVEELLFISKEFPPPPEGEIADVCDPGGFPVGNFDIAMISLIAIFSVFSTHK